MIIRTRVVHGIGWQGPESMGDMTRVRFFRDDPWTSHTVSAAPCHDTTSEVVKDVGQLDSGGVCDRDGRPSG
jgi:hypothetical protein